VSSELAPGITFHLVNSLGWPSLRPLQRAAVAPIRSGRSALLVAPTAGGKTEAAVLPLLSEMVDSNWSGLTVLYVTPLRALLNNLHPRLQSYASWVGRRVGLWHGDVGAGERRRLLADPPDLLLTTPESLEAMLVSTKVDHRHLFGNLRALVVDELHAFAGDDRGWHLLAVAERIEHLAGRPIQRIGMTATVGNPHALLTWLTRADQTAGRDAGVLLAPEASSNSPASAAPAGAPGSPAAAPAGADVVIDYVGSTANAAKVIDVLHPGQKRLVFCQSRAQSEKVAAELRVREVPVVVSHSSLSAEERRRAEQTFSEATACVVVATSTLELGIDIGDLDRVIQLDAPATVASFLQRLGRTGRRPGTRRNMLFLATTDDGLIRASALLHLWAAGFVEPVVPPLAQWHIAAQQLLALGLQEGRYSLAEWRNWWPGLAWMNESREILQHLLDAGYLGFDSGFAMVGPESERAFGRRNFLELTSVFTAAPELKVWHGRSEVGAVSPLTLSARRPPEAALVLSLAGRAWLVTHVDWRRRQVFVVPDSRRGKSVWQGAAADVGFELAQAVRQVLAGAEAPVEWSQRAVARMAEIRCEAAGWVTAAGSSLTRSGSQARWWTWAGTKANNSLVAALTAQGLDATANGLAVDIVEPVDVAQLRNCADLLTGPTPPTPIPDDGALEGLKFAALLPEAMALDLLGHRMADPAVASEVAAGPIANVASS
jgi:ATP-dependent Lhr-like helicase